MILAKPWLKGVNLTSPRYAGMIPDRYYALVQFDASPRYAGMILKKMMKDPVMETSPRYAGMIPN